MAYCAGFEILNASSCAGSSSTQLNRKKMSRITPAIVGIICHSLRITYAVIAFSSLFAVLLARQLLRGHVDVQVLEVGIENRVFLVALHPRVLRMVEDTVQA